MAARRVAKAKALVPAALKKGRVLDIGCGFIPYLLTGTDFSEKYGVARGIDEELKMLLRRGYDLALIDVDLERAPRIPFQSGFFEVVTMLAVMEHIQPYRISGIVQEIRRILKPGGVFIMATPAKWTKGLFRFLTRINVVSRVEGKEHKGAYSKKRILALLEDGGFRRPSIASGYFTLFMNIWARARKD